MKKIILLCSFLLIAVGIYNGEVNIVITKAINICMECIGIG
ncbi:CD1871A family CXXC motif-containing protein [Anaerosphaera aminiphila]|nr:CD1871A family CXXC motif-containing protein [Anaerosphaera aminiphila]